MTARRARREIDGIVLLDKPAGLSSNGALQRVRRLLSAAKAGHAGTLDPMATGMLPLCLGQATKACGSLLGGRKAYRFRLQLGIATDTGDAEGSPVATQPVPVLTSERVLEVLRGFEGEGTQVPPMHSALKHEGERLYALARRGREVPRAARRIELGPVELLDRGDDWLEVEVVCSKGTYVRVLGEDLARALGTVGHLTTLRRLWVEPFRTETMVELAAVERWAEGIEGPESPPFLLPVDRAFKGWRTVRVDASGARALEQGRQVPGPTPMQPIEPGEACAYDESGRFVGLVAVASDGSLRTLRLFRRPAASAAPRAT